MRPPLVTTGDCHKLLFLVSVHPAFQAEGSDLQQIIADIWDLVLNSAELEYFAKWCPVNLNKINTSSLQIWLSVQYFSFDSEWVVSFKNSSHNGCLLN